VLPPSLSMQLEPLAAFGVSQLLTSASSNPSRAWMDFVREADAAAAAAVASLGGALITPRPVIGDAAILSTNGDKVYILFPRERVMRAFSYPCWQSVGVLTLPLPPSCSGVVACTASWQGLAISSHGPDAMMVVLTERVGRGEALHVAAVKNVITSDKAQ
jgi:hypothetical protein